MKRIFAIFLAGPLLISSQAAPVFTTGSGSVTMPSNFSGYINLGLQGVGRISASQLDAFGETFGSVSGLQVTNWKLSSGAYTGSFITLPDRGYNSGSIYSDYRTRVQQVDFSFTPYTGSAALSSPLSQISLNYMGGSLLTLSDGPANTTGALPTTNAALQVGTLTTGLVPKTSGGKISVDAEGLALFADGSGYVTDEYGPNIYYIQNGNIASVINPPASAMPRTSGGTLTYTVSGTSAADPTTGRRGNQGMESVAISPDGSTLFTMLQSATMQDSTSGSQNRQYARLYKYDVSQSRSNPTLVAEYVVELPRLNDSNADQAGLIPNKTAAQSEMVALDGDRIMLLSRDSNGNGIAAPAPAVFKSVMIADLSKGGTNILSQDTSSGFTVKNGTVSTSIAGDFTTKLKDGITAVSPVQFVSIIDATQLAKFGLNTNDGSSGALRNSATLSEKWEGMALVSALDPSKPNDYFLFVANDNDFLTTKLKMKSTDGTTVTTAGSLGASVENDTMFLAYRVTLPLGTSDTTLSRLALSSSPSQAAVGVVDGGTALSSGSSTYDISATTLLVPGSLTVTRPIDVGADGGALNLLGNKVVLNGSVSGSGALTVFGTSSASALTLSGTNTYAGGTEVNTTRLQVSASSNLGTGQVNLNAGAVLALTQSGSFSNAAGYYVGGGTMEVASGKSVVWNGSLTGTGSMTKSGAGSLELKGSSSGFSGGVNVTSGSLSIRSGTTTWSAGSGSLSLSSGARLDILMGGTVDLTNKITAVPTSSIYWTGADSASVLKLNTTIPKIYNTNNVGSISLGLTGKTLIYANGLYYQPFAAGLAAGTPVYMDAEGTSLNATQRSLGYREVAYKSLFFSSLNFTSATTSTDADGNTIYNYGSPSTSSNLVGYWTKKNLPIIIGPDGKGYITDGHHTTAGYLASAGAQILVGSNHVVLGTIVGNPSSQTSVNDQMWTDFANSNNAYLYGTSGNQLIQPGETQGAATYSGLQPILPSAGGVAMPTTPGTASMANDLYRSLTWGMADGIVKTATNVSGTKLAGYLKVDPNSPTGADVNFIEFYWGDFLRERVLWNDNAAVTSTNLMGAPVSFFAAVANGIAMAKSELYVDQFGRSLTDYTGSNFSLNTQNWANASLKNGLAATGDTYNLYLTDDVTISGNILASAVDGVVSNLNINTGTGMTIAGALQNFTSIAVNTGGTLTIDWKDSSVNALSQNKTLTIASGVGNVLLSGDNDYRMLAALAVGAGRLTFKTDNATSDQVIWANISGAGALAKEGEGVLVLSGSNTFTGGFTLSKGALVLDSTSTLSDSGQILGSPVGLGTLTVAPSTDAGALLAFTENVLLRNRLVLSGAGITLGVDSAAVELAGDVVFDSSPVSVYGPSFSALTLSGTGNSVANLVVYGMNLRTSDGALVEGSTVTLNGGATLASARQFSLNAGSLASDDLSLNISLVLVDEGRLNAGQGTLTMNGVVSGDGRLVITADSPSGAVRLNNTNTFTGGITVQGGATLRFSADENLGDASGAVTLESGVLSYVGGSSLVVNASRSLVVSQSGLLDVGSGTLTWAGEIAGAGDLTVGSEDTVGSLVLESGASAAFSGRVIVSGGSLVIGHASALSGAAVDLSNTSRLSDSGSYVTGGLIRFTGISSGTFGSLAGDRALALPSSFGLTVGGNDGSTVYSGSLSGEGASLTKVGSGVFTLSGENSFSGVTEVRGGVLSVSNKRALANSTLNLTSSSGTALFNTSEVILGGLSGSGSLNITDGRRFTVGGNNQTTSYSGIISGTTGIFEKAGSGNLTLSGASTFRGEVALSGGTLTLGKYSLQNSTLRMASTVSEVRFTTNEAILGGLAGEGALNLVPGAKLTIGGNNVSTLYSGILSSGSVSLTKTGTGNFQLDGASGGSSSPITLNLQSGGVLLSPTVSLAGGSVNLSSLSTLGIASNGGTYDYSSTSFTLSSGTTSANLVFNGVGTSSKLILPGSLDTSKIRLLNLGDGTIVLGGTLIGSGSSRSVVSSGEVIPTSRPEKLELGSGAKAALPSTSAGTLDLSQAVSSSGGAYQIPSDGVYTMSVAPSANARGALEVEGRLNLSFGAVSGVVSMNALSGGGTVALQGGNAKIPESSSFTGTAMLASGAVAELSGSLGDGRTGSFIVSSGGSLNVNPASATQTAAVPALVGQGAVAMSAGKIEMGGDNTLFTGTISVASGVQVTVKGNLPTGTVRVQDPTTPLKVDTSSGNITLPGSVTGSGALALTGSGTVTMTSSASIGTNLLKVGTSSADRAVLDVSRLNGGALVLGFDQTLSGGGKVVGSVVTNGVFSPGNSPGTFTVGKAASNTGGDLTLNGPVLIEYGKNSGTGNYDTDVVLVSGTLTFGAGSSIVLSKYSDGATYGNFATSTLSLGSIFQAGSISGTPTVSLASGGLLASVTSTISGGSLQLAVVKASYGSVVSSANSQSIGDYLSAVSSGTVGSSLGYLLSALDASASASQLEANLKSLSAPVYAEAQRLSLRRTAAISETLQGHLTAFPEGDHDGLTAWSESYAWGLHRNSTASADSWNGNTTGEVLGVQYSRKGLTFGAFGAKGYTSASFSSSMLKADSIHGGLYARVEAGMPFLDFSWMAGSADQTATRSIAVGSYSSSARSSFQTSEYAVCLRGGLTIPKVAGSYKVVPSIAVLRNGYNQDGASESGADGANLTTERARRDAWQTRLGSEISRPFKAGRSPANLLASAYWIHDFNRSARTVNARFSDVNSAAGQFTASGEPVGGDGLELGLGATVAFTNRTSARLSGSWQLRDGLNQPSLNLGVTVQF